MKIEAVIIGIFAKTSDIFRHVWGWVASIFLFVANIFAPHFFIVNLIIAVTLMDAIWGITLAIKQRKFVLSELLRQTVAKIAVYGCAIFGFAGLDYYIQTNTGLEISVTTAIIGIVIILTELWSSCAAMLILYPNFPFLRLMQKVLVGEIARKMQVEESVVKEMLNIKK